MANQEQIILTGAAGFIGSHLAIKLKNRGLNVLAVDSMVPAQSISLAEDRRNWVKKSCDLDIVQLNLTSNSDISQLEKLMRGKKNTIFHLAAFPGVRDSSKRASEYFLNNVIATSNIFELANRIEASRVFFASSSSVYGERKSSEPMTEGRAQPDFLRSFYALTKYQNELDAERFSHFLHPKFTALRFFTVYGPYGRPDMAYWFFSQLLLQGKPIPIYGLDGGSRSYTFIDDVTEILYQLLFVKQIHKFEIFNIGNPKTESTIKMVTLLAEKFKIKEFEITKLDRPREDVSVTECNSTKLLNQINFQEFTSLSSGIDTFANWFMKSNYEGKNFSQS